MQVAIALGTFLLGGWVLDSPIQDQATLPDSLQPPAAASSTQPYVPNPAPAPKARCRRAATHRDPAHRSVACRPTG